MSECKSVSSACSHSLIFLIFSFSLIQFVEGICPDAKSIEPCTCNDEGLQCLRLDDDDLERVFSADAQRKAIRRVWIFQTNLTKLKPNAFGDYIIGDLFLDINKIDFVDEDAFGYASKTLKLLSLTRNRLTTFPFDVLKKSPRLDKFSLAFNQLTRLPNTIESSKLTHLDLSYNSITDIAPHTFYWMTGLQILNLARNMLTTIKTHALWMHATGPLVSNLLMMLLRNCPQYSSHCNTNLFIRASSVFLTKDYHSARQSD